MARPIWSGSLSFGLLNIPVSLMSGERRTDISFRTRLRAEITFRQLMRNIRERSTGRPAPAATP